MQQMKSQRSVLYSKMVRYIPAIVVSLAAFVVSSVLLSNPNFNFAVNALILVLSLPVTLGLITYFIGIVLEIYNHELSGEFFKSFVAPSAFVFFALDALFSILSLLSAAFLFSLFLVPLLLLANALILNRFADTIIGGKQDQPFGLAAKRLAIALGIAFFASFLSLSPPTMWIGYPLYYSSLTYGVLSVSPIIAYSKQTENFKEAGLYLMRTALQWSVVAFFIGIAALVLTFTQNNILVYAVLITFGAIVIGIVGFRIYSLGAARIAKESQAVYQKHIHNLTIIQDESFDYLRNNVNEFIRTGRKENLLIALTSLLTNAGFPFERSAALLGDLSNYEIPAIHKIPYLSMKKSFEMELDRRARLINGVFSSIAQEASVQKAA
jgi:hypothetical protein